MVAQLYEEEVYGEEPVRRDRAEKEYSAGANDEEDGLKVQLAVETDLRRQKKIKFRDRNTIVWIDRCNCSQ
jgi:hypothetical protein